MVINADSFAIKEVNDVMKIKMTNYSLLEMTLV